MKNILIPMSFLLLSSGALADTAKPKIDGLWEASYDASHTPSAHIRITTKSNGELVGVIEQAYPRPGETPSPNCTKCTGANKDKPIVGMTVVWGMKPDGKNVWDGGYVLDAETGKEYTGKITLADSGNELDLRGYVFSSPSPGQSRDSRFLRGRLRQAKGSKHDM